MKEESIVVHLNIYTQVAEDVINNALDMIFSQKPINLNPFLLYIDKSSKHNWLHHYKNGERIIKFKGKEVPENAILPADEIGWIVSKYSFHKITSPQDHKDDRKVTDEEIEIVKYWLINQDFAIRHFEKEKIEKTIGKGANIK